MALDIFGSSVSLLCFQQPGKHKMTFFLPSAEDRFRVVFREVTPTFCPAALQQVSLWQVKSSDVNQSEMIELSNDNSAQ